jgi:hypothetical protein
MRRTTAYFSVSSERVCSPGRFPASATDRDEKKRRCRSFMASFHMCKACRSAYKAPFAGARGGHVQPQQQHAET